MQFEAKTRGFSWLLCLSTLAACVSALVPSTAQAANLQWAGRSWKVTSGGMAGVAQGSPSNVSVDSSGYLHLKITNTGGTWTAAELFTTDNLGFGTYQWQVDAAIDRFDKNVVLGLYPYGPAAGIGTDGTNEIDIEYSFWGNANGVNGDWTDYPNSGTTIGEKSYKFSLNGGTHSTSRFIWSATSIQDFLISGFEPVASSANLINSWTYAPSNPSTNIPQQAVPLGINLWCFDAPPSDGKNVEVVIRDFQFVPEGSSPGGTGGTGGIGGMGGTSAGAGSNAGGAGGAGSAAHAGAGGAQNAAGTTSSAGGASAAAGSSAGGASATAGSSGIGAAATSGATATGGATTGAGGAPTGSAGSAASVAGANGGSTTGNPAAPNSSSDSAGCSCSLGATERRSRSTFFLLLPASLWVLGRRLRRTRR